MMKPIMKTELVKRNFRRILLEEKVLIVVQIFQIEEVVSKYDSTKNCYNLVSRKLVSEKSETVFAANLVEITSEELKKFRRSKTPSFVLKEDGKYFYAKIPRTLSFVSCTLLGPHKCAVAGHECRRLSAAPDELGGCAKVRQNSWGIERYPWITCGYESFNTSHDSFVVLNCDHYEKCPPRANHTATEVAALKLGLAQFVWDDVTSLAQSRVRQERNNIKDRR